MVLASSRGVDNIRGGLSPVPVGNRVTITGACAGAVLLVKVAHNAVLVPRHRAVVHLVGSPAAGVVVRVRLPRFGDCCKNICSVAKNILPRFQSTYSEPFIVLPHGGLELPGAGVWVLVPALVVPRTRLIVLVRVVPSVPGVEQGSAFYREQRPIDQKKNIENSKRETFLQ